jgi:hypothetical protein
MNRRQDGASNTWPTNPFWLVPIDPCRLEKSLEDWETDGEFGALITGRLRFELEALTPVHIAGQRVTVGQGDSQKIDRSRFYREGGVPVIPGASLRGMTRHLIEAYTAARIETFTKDKSSGRTVSDRHNNPQTKPRRPESIDIATLLFGYVDQAAKRPGNQDDAARSLRGRLVFDDVLLESAQFQDVRMPDTKGRALYGGPTLEDDEDEDNKGRAGRTGWYLDRDGHFAGRKFYFHQNPKGVEQSLQRTMQNNPRFYWYPCESWMPGGARPILSIVFQRIPMTLVQMLAAVLGGEYWAHKLGAGKPFGLGSVQFHLKSLEYRNEGDGLCSLMRLDSDAAGRPLVGGPDYWANGEDSPLCGRLCSESSLERLHRLLSFDPEGYSSRNRHSAPAMLYPNPLQKKQVSREQGSKLDVYQKSSSAWRRLAEIADLDG